MPPKPKVPTVAPTSGSTTSLDVRWTAPDGQVTSYDLQYRAGTVGAWTNGPQDVTGTSSVIGSLIEGTSYQVQVRASNAEGDGDWSDPASGTPGAVDTTAPVLAATDPATVNGASLTLTYDEALDTNSVPAASAFGVSVGGGAEAPPSGVAVRGNAVTLTLVSAVTGR